ncbi:MAG: DUF4070 domain-containing protein, partial [Phaeodactylibacter sp.]|nr:DUF4070 domain-containing protein [Phaeodactylibacter sp.]
CSIHIADRPDMLELAAKSGCRLLSIGIETTNRKSLLTVAKDFNHPEKYTEQLNRIRKHGIDISTEMMIGLDGDDESTFQDIYDFVMDNRIALPRVHILTPVPGTQLYREMEAEDRLLTDNLGKYSGSNVIHRPKNIAPEVLQDNYWKLYEQLYKPGRIFKRLSASPKNQNAFLKAFLTGANLHYRSHIKRRITPGII